jgi:hypothetical protein
MNEIAVKACRKVNDSNDLFSTGGIGGSTYTEFKIGETYELPDPEKLELCEYGFHYFRKEDLCFGIDLFEEETVFIEIEVLGEVVLDTYKRCTNKFKVLRYIPKKEWKKLIKGSCNSGNCNSGWRNSGNNNSGNRNSGNHNSGWRNSGNFNSGNDNSGWRNSGFRNSGNENSGYYNSGDRNSGKLNSGNNNSGNNNSGNFNSGNSNSGSNNSGCCNSGNNNSGWWNSGSYNSGHFNRKIPTTINIFDKPCLVEKWENCEKPKFLFFNIREGETYKQAFQRSWNNASPEDHKLLESLPNFNWEAFTEISGIEKPK